MYRKTRTVTAVVITAVTLVAVFGSCCTKRDIQGINDRLAMLESQSRETLDLVKRMDSLVVSSSETNRQLQNDVRMSSDALAQQLGELLENYNDLISRIDRMSHQVIKLPPTSSPGAQGPSEPAPGGAQPSADCIDTYDNAFTQVRRGEYETAIQGFRKFLTDCSTHADVQNAYYWIGECYYSQEKYTEAVTEYEHLINTYRDSPNLGRAIYKLARCKHELGKTSEAKELFQRLIDQFGGSLEAEQAAARLKDM
jgi:tol-pal system protein YbgF